MLSPDNSSRLSPAVLPRAFLILLQSVAFIFFSGRPPQLPIGFAEGFDPGGIRAVYLPTKVRQLRIYMPLFRPFLDSLSVNNSIDMQKKD